MPVRQLRRVRWAVRAALALGVAASVAANVLHAERNPVAQAIAAWPPLALLLNVELISRVPMHRRHLAGIRLVATAAIAGIAAWVSYWHMVAVAARYGETGSVPYLLPLSVDGLVIVASVSLVELAGRIRAVEQQAAPVPTRAPVATTPVAGAAPAVDAVPGRPAGTAVPGRPGGSLVGSPVGSLARPPVGPPTGPPVGPAAPALPAPLGTGVAAGPNGTSGVPGPARPGTRVTGEQPDADRRTPARVAAAERRPGRTTGTVSVSAGRSRTPRPTGKVARTAPAGKAASGSGSAPAGRAAPRPRRPVAETLRLIEEITAERPHATDDELADALGITLRRLRTVRAAA